jgi:hypothetical protein
MPNPDTPFHNLTRDFAQSRITIRHECRNGRHRPGKCGRIKSYVLKLASYAFGVSNAIGVFVELDLLWLLPFWQRKSLSNPRYRHFPTPPEF